jgi:hypothetical protein
MLMGCMLLGWFVCEAWNRILENADLPVIVRQIPGRTSHSDVLGENDL